MNAVPFNRHLLVAKPTEEEQKEGLVIVPDEYKAASAHALVEVLDFAEDCNGNWEEGDLVIVPSHILETISYKSTEYYLVLENHVLMGFLE